MNAPAFALLLAALPSSAVAQGELHRFPPGELAAAGDVDNDGRRDVLLGLVPGVSAWPAGEVSVRSGLDGSHLLDYRPQPPVLLVGHRLGAVGDVDADGHGDVACVEVEPSGPFLVVLSGANGATLLRLAAPVATADFGRAIVGLGDLDGDGASDFAVGAPSSGSFPPTPGAVHIYSGATGAILRTLAALGGESGFGAALDLRDDVDGDGRPDLLLGATQHASVASPGRVYVVSAASGAALALVTGVGQGFGTSVASLGDTDGDGLGDFAVGDPTESYGFHRSGSVSVFSGSRGALLRKWDAVQQQTALGRRVASVGDYDGDLLADVLLTAGTAHVGANGQYPRAVEIRSPATGALLYEGAADDGRSLASLGDLNADGAPDYAIGERFDYVTLTTVSSAILTRAPQPGNDCFWPTPNTNSLGCAPHLAHTGAPCLSIGAEFHVLASALRNGQNGLLLWSLQPGYRPFAGQLLCIGAPYGRFGIQPSGGSASGDDCTGTFDFAVPKSTMSALGWSAGTYVFTQAWSRDPDFVAHGRISLSDALVFAVWP